MYSSSWETRTDLNACTIPDMGEQIAIYRGYVHRAEVSDVRKYLKKNMLFDMANAPFFFFFFFGQAVFLSNSLFSAISYARIQWTKGLSQFSYTYNSLCCRIQHYT